MRHTVLLLLDAESGWYTAYVPAIPACVTQGASIEDALRRAQSAAHLVIEDMVAPGEELPAETGTAVLGAVDLSVPALVGT